MTAGFVVTLLVGALCVFLGIRHMRGDLSSLHSYHRHRVKEEDRLPFGRLVGAGTVAVGASVVLLGTGALLSEVLALPVLLFVGMGVAGAGIAFGLGLSFWAMCKYNGGIF